MYSAGIRLSLTLIPALLLLWAAPASADPRFAVDHFEPSERGSEWFANESLGFEGPKLGPVLVNAGVVSSFAERPFEVDDLKGNTVRTPVRDYWVLHAGGDAILFKYLRLAVDLPVQTFVGGKAIGPYGSPAHDQGVGDLRFGADVRVMGHDHGLFRLALGAQLWAPTGSQPQWSSDGAGEWRLRPRAIAAGDIEWFTWSGQFGWDFRKGAIGNEVSASAAAGVRLCEHIVVGPEAFFNAATTHPSVPFEAMVGAHWRLLHLLQVGAAIGRGFTNEPGSPEYRIIASVEYAPEFGPPPVVVKAKPVPPPPPTPRDDDHDGVTDDIDACKGIAGIATSDPATTGCPPDTDGDGVNDLNDACPTQPGKKTDDPATNGCP